MQLFDRLRHNIIVSQTSIILIVIFVACIAANLPFSSNRFLGVGPIFCHYKTLPICLIELVSYYFLVGVVALFLENSIGQISPQGWEFYATTVAFFITLAFPSFVYKYLVSRPRK